MAVLRRQGRPCVAPNGQQKFGRFSTPLSPSPRGEFEEILLCNLKESQANSTSPREIDGQGCCQSFAVLSSKDRGEGSLTKQQRAPSAKLFCSDFSEISIVIFSFSALGRRAGRRDARGLACLA